MFGVIYGIENLINHKIYIGQTHRNIEVRLKEHKTRKTSLIGRAIQKYGWENFIWTVLEKCDNRDELNAAEIRWIASLNCKSPNGYNSTEGGAGTIGRIVSQETRKKLSDIHKGTKLSADTRRKISIAAMGNKNFLGHKLSDEHRQKLSASRKGKPLTKEHRQKLSAAHKGKTAWNKGKTTPPEVRAKLSAARKAYLSRIKENPQHQKHYRFSVEP